MVLKVNKLTDDPSKIEAYEIRLRLMDILIGVIKKNEWDQNQSAEHFDCSQSRISYLVTRKVHRFNIDLLIKLLSKVGYTFDFMNESLTLEINEP